MAYHKTAAQQELFRGHTTTFNLDARIMNDCYVRDNSNQVAYLFHF